jgi:hypothetical protein
MPTTNATIDLLPAGVDIPHHRSRMSMLRRWSNLRTELFSGFREKVRPPETPAEPLDWTGLVPAREQPEAHVPIAARIDRDLDTFDLTIPLGSVKPLPTGLLSREVIERLRSGEPLSVADLEKLRSATSADAGIVEKLMEGLLAAGFVESQDPGGADSTLPAGLAGDHNVAIVPASAQKFKWTWKSNKQARETGSEPATYYEALTGQPDPMRSFFVTARRLLDVVTWVIALGVPLGLVALAIVTGQAPDTIFFMGFAGLLVGMMFKRSFPRTPFG